MGVMMFYQDFLSQCVGYDRQSNQRVYTLLTVDCTSGACSDIVSERTTCLKKKKVVSELFTKIILLLSAEHGKL